MQKEIELEEELDFDSLASSLAPSTTEPLQDVPDGYTFCPDCEKLFKTRGYKRHRTMTHGDDRSSPIVSGLSSSRSGRGAKFETAVTNLYRTIGLGISVLGMEDANIWAENIDPMSESMVDLANTYPAVKRMLDGLMKGSVIGAVILSHVPVMYMIASHHMNALPKLEGLTSKISGVKES